MYLMYVPSGSTLFQLQIRMSMPKSVLGADGVLRSSQPLDLTRMPKLEGRSSVPKHLMDLAKADLEKNGDRPFLINAELG